MAVRDLYQDQNISGCKALLVSYSRNNEKRANLCVGQLAGCFWHSQAVCVYPDANTHRQRHTEMYAGIYCYSSLGFWCLHSNVSQNKQGALMWPRHWWANAYPNINVISMWLCLFYWAISIAQNHSPNATLLLVSELLQKHTQTAIKFGLHFLKAGSAFLQDELMRLNLGVWLCMLPAMRSNQH